MRKLCKFVLNLYQPMLVRGKTENMPCIQTLLDFDIHEYLT